VRVSRVGVNVIMVVAIVVGIAAGIRLYAFFAGG
jgi:hypothetical protein